MIESSHRTGRSWVRWTLIFILTVLAIGVAGCLLLTWWSESYHHAPVSQTAGSKDLYVELWVSDRCPTVGETVTVRATVTNEGAHIFTVELKDRPVLDLLAGTKRWSQLNSELTRLELKPGQSKSIEMQYVVEQSSFGVSARFVPDAQSIEHPISPYMIIGNCPGFIGP